MGALSKHTDISKRVIKKCNLLIVHPDMAYGGAERQIVNLVGGLSKTGAYRIFVALYECSGKFLNQISQLSEVQVIDLEKRKLNYLKLILRLRKITKQKDIDVVYSFLIGPNILVGLTTLTTKIDRVVWGNRVSEFKPFQFGFKGWVAELLSRCLSYRIDAIISNSWVGMESLEQRNVLANENTIIANGIDLDKFFQSKQLRLLFRENLEVADSTIVIAQIGRIVNWKGHETYIRAAAQLLDMHSNVKFVIVGDGRPLWVDHLRDLAVSLQLEDNLLWLGSRDDIEVVLNGVDILTVPSSSGEGFPNIIGEAMAIGIPVVATDIGATAEILNECGIVVQPNNVGALVKAWSILINKPGYRRQLGSYGVDQVRRHYSVARMVQRTDDFLRSDKK